MALSAFISTQEKWEQMDSIMASIQEVIKKPI
jgi:hypothetical protein